MNTELVGLQFLAARKAQRCKLRDLHSIILEQPAQPAEHAAAVADRAAEHSAEDAQNLVAGRCLLPLFAVLRRDMAHFMPQHPGQFSFVVHQRHQLARDIDIAAGDREGVVNG